MALLTLEGIYEDGKIELREIPKNVKRSRVSVTFLAPEEASDAERREALRQRFLARLQRGVDFGTDPLPTREELYADRLDHFEKSFVDTNIFAYAEDRRETLKRPMALSLIQRLSDAGQMVISTQVLNEFCAILLRGRVGDVTNEEDLKALVEELEVTSEVVMLTTDMTREAVRAVYTYSISWYDALIWAAAKAAGCTTIYTEDVPGKPEIEGVRYANPFTQGSED